MEMIAHTSLYISLVAVLLCAFWVSIIASVGIGFVEPVFKDPNLRAELITKGLSSPTSMAFVDNDNILVLEKNTGDTACFKRHFTARSNSKIRSGYYHINVLPWIVRNSDN